MRRREESQIQRVPQNLNPDISDDPEDMKKLMRRLIGIVRQNEQELIQIHSRVDQLESKVNG